MSTLAPPDLRSARAAFSGGRGYLAACTVGLPPRATRAAVIADLDAAAAGRATAADYSAVVERTRGHFARLVGADVSRIAIGSQASVFAGLLAAAVPDGAEVLCAEGDFSSIVLPFVHAGRGVRVRTAPLDRLADAITADTWLVAFSLVQSASGEVADAVAISSIVRREPRELVAAELDYAQAHALSSESTRRAWAIETANGERVTVTVAVPSSQVDDVEHLISNLTSGNTRGVRRGTRWVDLPS